MKPRRDQRNSSRNGSLAGTMTGIVIGVLGLGEAGGHIAADLAAAGVRVRGFDPRLDPGVEPHWNGQSRLDACWARVGVIGLSDGGRFVFRRGRRFIRCRWNF